MDNQLISFYEQAFDQIPIGDWYQISNLRERVFIVEQNCPYLDADGKDLRAHHITGRNKYGKIEAYARIVHPDDEPVQVSKLEYVSDSQRVVLDSDLKSDDDYYFIPAIGRVVLDPDLRGQEWGHILMEHTMTSCLKMFNGQPIFISAQKPLRQFYEHHGFSQTGPGYLEDDIPHIPMLFIYK